MTDVNVKYVHITNICTKS